MTLSLHTETVFLLLVIAAGLLSVPVLLLNKSNKAANRILAAVQLVVAGGLFHNLLLAGGVYDANPQLYFLPVSLRFAIGPLLWWYVHKLTGGKKLFIAFHLLPVAFVFLFECYAFSLDVEAKWQLWQKIEWYWNQVYFWIYQLQLTGYLILSLLQLVRWKKRVENQFSDTDKISLSALRKLLTGVFLLLVAGAGWRIAQQITGINSIILPSDLVKGIMLLGVCWFSIRQNQISVIHTHVQTETLPQLLEDEPGLVVDMDIPAADKTEPLRVNEELLAGIISLMETEKPFLNPELSLYQLARQLNQPAKLVSSTINRGTGQTFQAFVNAYRVKEVMRQIENGQHKQHTLLAIALDAGFNSKATFNRVFRAQTGKTPGEFVSIHS
ncbi:MAG: AraC family transcriptional regulator [Bacteroidetes bacterium]|nr:AraC family transcriptional regulator [Bacteroidota bacterium]